MAPKTKKHQFEDNPPVQPKRDAGYAEVNAPVNICPVDSPHINTQAGNEGVLSKVQKVMYPTFGRSTSDGPNIYDSTTSGRR
jgi:hypothetical protein